MTTLENVYFHPFLKAHVRNVRGKWYIMLEQGSGIPCGSMFYSLTEMEPAKLEFLKSKALGPGPEPVRDPCIAPSWGYSHFDLDAIENATKTIASGQ